MSEFLGIKKRLLDIRENVRGVDEVKQEVANKEVAKVRKDKAR